MATSSAKTILKGLGKAVVKGASKTASTVLGLFGKNSSVPEEKSSPKEILGNIYTMLSNIKDDKKANYKKRMDLMDDEEDLKNYRNKEVIKVLKGIKKYRDKLDASKDKELKKTLKEKNALEEELKTLKESKEPTPPTPTAPTTEPPKTTTEPPKTTETTKTDKAATDKAAADKARTDKAAADKAAADKAAADKAAADKAKAEEQKRLEAEKNKPSATPEPAPTPAKQPEPVKKPEPAPTPAPAPAPVPLPKPPTNTAIPISKNAADIGVKQASKFVIAGGLGVIASNVIASNEGLAKGLKAMPDEDKVAIGYGHDITEQEYKQGYVLAKDEKIMLKGNRGLDTTFTKEQAIKLLETDLPKYAKPTEKAMGTAWSKLNDTQKAVLVDYSYNAGVGSEKKGNGLYKLINHGLIDAIDKGDMQLAAEIIREHGVKTGKKSGYLENLEQRRYFEASLFEKGFNKSNSSIPQSTNTGNQVDKSSTELNDQRRTLDEKAQGSNSIANIIQQSLPNSNNTPPENADDRNAYEKKKGK